MEWYISSVKSTILSIYLFAFLWHPLLTVFLSFSFCLSLSLYLRIFLSLSLSLYIYIYIYIYIYKYRSLSIYLYNSLFISMFRFISLWISWEIKFCCWDRLKDREGYREKELIDRYIDMKRFRYILRDR